MREEWLWKGEEEEYGGVAARQRPREAEAAGRGKKEPPRHGGVTSASARRSSTVWLTLQHSSRVSRAEPTKNIPMSRFRRGK